VTHTHAVAPPAQGHNPREATAYALFIVCGLLTVTFPGALLGAATAYLVWRATRTDLVSQWLIAALAAATAVALRPNMMLAWSWTTLVHLAAPGASDDFSITPILTSLPSEMLLGFQLGAAYRRDTIHGEEWLRFNKALQRKQALQRQSLAGAPQSREMAHPLGKIRLGISLEDQRAFDLSIEDISQHIFVPGASGSGKTTTLARLADGALANGYGVVIVDCKGVGLGGVTRKLAANHGVAFTIVDPQDATTVGYDPCTGDAATIANKLIGAFSFSDEAESYKHVAMEVVPVICRAMLAAGIGITLSTMYEALGRGGLARLLVVAPVQSHTGID
jgi:Type IV secretion-system coupling protein DNA-binding domain